MNFLIEEQVKRALEEDFGRLGDLTTNSLVSVNAVTTGLLNARKPGVIAGLQVAETAFRILDPNIVFTAYRHDGESVDAGTSIAKVIGATRALLSAERVALNFLCHMSGIATATRELVRLVSGYPVKICDTRKTTPGLRTLEKYAVRQGGGFNHRFGLDDGVLVKDNHIVAAGSISEAIYCVRLNLGHMVKIEVEVDRIDQIPEVLEAKADAILLDNMSIEELARAVALIDHNAIVEASGTINKDTVAEVAATGVDVISSGWITHSAPILDIGFDFS